MALDNVIGVCLQDERLFKMGRDMTLSEQWRIPHLQIQLKSFLTFEGVPPITFVLFLKWTNYVLGNGICLLATWTTFEKAAASGA